MYRAWCRRVSVLDAATLVDKFVSLSLTHTLTQSARGSANRVTTRQQRAMQRKSINSSEKP